MRSEAKTVNDKPTERLRLYAENLARGMDSYPAAKAAGYRDTYARVIGTRMQNNPAVTQAIEEIRKKGLEMASYGLVVAMQEALEDHTFAVEKGNAMAAVKATELRAKLAGLLIERHEIVEVDLTGALARAQSRVLTVTGTPLRAIGPAALPVPSKAPIDWRPHIPGNPVADTQAGGSQVSR